MTTPAHYKSSVALDPPPERQLPSVWSSHSYGICGLPCISTLVTVLQCLFHLTELTIKGNGYDVIQFCRNLTTLETPIASICRTIFCILKIKAAGLPGSSSMISIKIHLVICQQNSNLQKAYLPTAQTSSSTKLLVLLLLLFCFIFMKELQILKCQLCRI